MDYDYLKYKKILIVDDEADLREMVTSILEQDGFKTIKTAGTVAEVERGEKNATLESIEKIASAMNVSLAQLFEKIGESSTDSYPMKCYELVAAKSKSEQEHLYKMLVEMDKYKNQ